jgi:hypothetical protein
MSQNNMTKADNTINSKITDDSIYLMKWGQSVNSGILVFFFIFPMLISMVEKILISNLNGIDTLLTNLKFINYYVLNGIATVLLVKWQNRKLSEKTIKFRKNYILIISAIVMSLVLLKLLW